MLKQLAVIGEGGGLALSSQHSHLAEIFNRKGGSSVNTPRSHLPCVNGVNGVNAVNGVNLSFFERSHLPSLIPYCFERKCERCA